MLDLNIQLFAEGDENEQGSNPTTPFKAFATEDEYNKFTQSISSKAKGEILNEIGYKSVSEIKENLGKVKEYEGFKTNYTELEGNFNTLKSEHEKIVDELVTTKYGVTDDFKNEFLTLAKAGVKEDVTLLQSAESVAKKFSTFQGTTPIKIGGAGGGTQMTEQEKIKHLRKL